MASRNLTVMFTDIQGFTSRTSASSRDDVRSLIEEHDRLLRPVFRHFDGVVVKTIGDAFLVRFDSPTDAVVCGLALQAVLKKHNETVREDERLAVRVAINVGDVEVKDGDVLGEPVNIAARLEGIAQPGEVWFTEAVYLTMNRTEVPTTEIGERVFKGIPQPIKVFKVVVEPPNEQIRLIDRSVRLERGVPKLEGLRDLSAKGNDSRPWLAAAIVALLLGPVAAVFGFQTWQEAREIQRVERLMEMGDSVAALALVDELLPQRADHQRLRELGLKATEQELERRLTGGVPEHQVRDWLAGLLNTHGHLAPLRERFIALDAQVDLKRAYARGRLHLFWDTFRELLQRHGDSPVVSLTAIRFLDDSNLIEETKLYPYRLLIEAGQADDPALREQIQATLELALSRNLPASAAANSANELGRKAFPDARRAWAEKAVAGDNGVALANALVILAEFQDPRAEEPFHQALIKLLERKDVDASIAILSAEQDPARRARAREVIQEAALFAGTGLSQAQRDQLAALGREEEQ